MEGGEVENVSQGVLQPQTVAQGFARKWKRSENCNWPDTEELQLND